MNAYKSKDWNEAPSTLDLGPDPKKNWLFRYADDATVVRAAGTFYPENITENDSDNFEQLSSDTGETLSSESLGGNDFAQDLSLKDKNETQINITDNLESSSTPAFPPMTAESSLDSHQIYNVLQMQQQLFAFYQQIALMAPTFSYLSTLGHTTAVQDPSSSQTSFTMTAEMQTEVLQNIHLVKNILDTQKQRANENSSCEQLPINTKISTVTSTITSSVPSTVTSPATKARNHTERLPINVSGAPETKLPEKPQECEREDIPPGFMRFRYNQDCGYEKCIYRKHQSHFHCSRIDCHYGFCDRTRFLQHTGRHQRLDSLMGSEFKQYRSSLSCNLNHCPYSHNGAKGLPINRRSSHFHCLRCPFICVDTNRVVSHRRLHNQMDSIRLAGFRKVAVKENCLLTNVVGDFSQEQPLEQYSSETINPDCPYALRHAHYHCLVCNFSVLSRSLLFTHKHREQPPE